jgi:hypothetical protein
VKKSTFILAYTQTKNPILSHERNPTESFTRIVGESFEHYGEKKKKPTKKLFIDETRSMFSSKPITVILTSKKGAKIAESTWELTKKSNVTENAL